jgi:ppGpp synthetase/RelA/SpoT-type nucleotidyltranferase
MARREKLSAEDRERAAEIGVTSIRAFYGSRAGDLDGDCEFLEGHLRRTLDRGGFSALAVKARPKKLSSAIDKIRRKCADANSSYASRLLKGEHPQQILTDLVGARITCKFSDQIDVIEELLKANYKLRNSARMDYRKPKEFGYFGYAALHLVGEPITASATQIYYSGCAFELQVRSALMDIWSVVNWDVAYTDEDDIPYEILRRMSTLSALFYLVDQEFIRIRTEASLGPERSAFAHKSPMAFEFSPAVAQALARRSINASELEHEDLLSSRTKAQYYYSKDSSLGRHVTVDALALYLLDKERFSWLINHEVLHILGEIDRIGVTR